MRMPYWDMIGEEDLAPISEFEIWGVVICSVHNPNESHQLVSFAALLWWFSR